MRESIQIMLPLRRILAYFGSSDLNRVEGYCIFYKGVEWVFGINATEKKILGFGIQLSHHARPLRPRLYIPLLATWSLRSPSSVLSPGGPTSRGTSPPVPHRRRIALLATCRCNVGFHAVSCYHKGWRQKQCCYVWNTDFFLFVFNDYVLMDIGILPDQTKFPMHCKQDHALITLITTKMLRFGVINLRRTRLTTVLW